jgi:hypothetical protein
METKETLNRANILRKAKENTNEALYNYLHEYLVRYKDSEKPRLHIFKTALLIRLTVINNNPLNKEKEKKIVTDQLCNNWSKDDKEAIIQLNMLIDHWIEEFNSNFYTQMKNNNYTKVTDETEFGTANLLLLNTCFENSGKDYVEKFSYNQNLLNMFGNFVLVNNFKMRSSNEVADCVNKFLQRNNFDSSIYNGSGNDLPPKGFVRIYGAESEADRNELVKFTELDNRIQEIMDEYTYADDYYRVLKFIWLRYEDGLEEQMCSRFWRKSE